jgi:hypothetical protein
MVMFLGFAHDSRQRWREVYFISISVFSFDEDFCPLAFSNPCPIMETSKTSGDASKSYP